MEDDYEESDYLDEEQKLGLLEYIKDTSKPEKVFVCYGRNFSGKTTFLNLFQAQNKEHAVLIDGTMRTDTLNSILQDDEKKKKLLFLLNFILQQANLGLVFFDVNKGGVLTSEYELHSPAYEYNAPDTIKYRAHEWRQHSSGSKSLLYILANVVGNNESKYVLIDEVENNIESSVLKRLLIVVSYLFVKDLIPQYYVELIEKYKIEYEAIINNKVILKSGSAKILIATHSPVALNYFSSFGQNVFLRFENLYAPLVHDRHLGKGDYSEINNLSIGDISWLQNTNDFFYDNFINPSDVMLSPGLICVEGPSDVVYVERWLQMWALENGFSKFQKGIHYNYYIYGGALLNHQGIYDVEKAVNLRKINPNLFFVFDSDFDVLSKTDRSKFEESKLAIMQDLGSDESKPFWFDQSVQTIEDYYLGSNEDVWKYDSRLSNEVKGNKFERANKTTEHWYEKKFLLAQIMGDKYQSFSKNIANLYETIKSWQVSC